MTSEREKEDLKIMHADLNVIRADAFDLMGLFLEMDDSDLKNTGFKTQQEAVYTSFRASHKECVDRVKRHIQKWPDK